MFIFNVARMIMEVNALYIDPGVTTALISGISGVAVAVGAIAVVYWRKAKKKAAEVLKIDENANKEVEDDLVINDEDGEN